MKLLLRETVDQLGTIGDIVNVPDGFGRNYLLPKGIALAVTPENIRRLEAKKAVLLAAEAAKRADAEALADKVKAKQVTIQAKAAGEEGKLYGSVTTQAIAEQFRKDGLPIEARMILLDQPIKELGVFDVRLRLFPQVEVEAKVWVVDESGGALPAAALAAAQEEKAEKPAKAEKPPKEKKEPKAEHPAEGAEAAEGEKPAKGKKAKAEKAEKQEKAAVEVMPGFPPGFPGGSSEEPKAEKKGKKK